MKRRQSKNTKFSKTTVGRRDMSSKKAAFVIKGRINSVDYARAISFLVKSEENETNLMIASTLASAPR